jgi:hypothetical protein
MADHSATTQAAPARPFRYGWIVLCMGGAAMTHGLWQLMLLLGTQRPAQAAPVQT